MASLSVPLIFFLFSILVISFSLFLSYPLCICWFSLLSLSLSLSLSNSFNSFSSCFSTFVWLFVFISYDLVCLFELKKKRKKEFSVTLWYCGTKFICYFHYETYKFSVVSYRFLVNYYICFFSFSPHKKIIRMRRHL